MMWNLGKKQSSGQGRSALRRIGIHLALLLAFWLILTLVVIPWDSGQQYPGDSFALIEGERAYAEIVRQGRPNLITTLRGLNMTKTQYRQEQADALRCVSFGNVRIFFDVDGDFNSLSLDR
ncbi:MAG: hypothetical protein LBV80_09780 [Deltaproteobacteria bacterium]|jgi:hypothetical protein|nr:hypothetical protein [Deltaproteobacteria bacterium]